MRFTPFESFVTLQKVGMMVEEELAREAPTKAGSNQKGSYQSKDKKAGSYKEVHAINHWIEYTLTRTTYIQKLE